VFGPGSGRSTARMVEAAQDLLVPVEDMRRDRIRRDALRRKTEQIAEFQTAFASANGRYARGDGLGVPTDGYHIEWTNSDYISAGWVASVSHDQSPRGEVCAVSMGREPAYAAGIPLLRMGRVRCSWDLATRINRIFR
jgi:hypothetical protein